MRAGVSGVRGVVGGGLGPPEVAALCESFGALAGAGRECALGMDTRGSGPMLAGAASAALRASGLDVRNLGVVPTPVVIRESASAGCGVAVTASHNPAGWNGLKFAVGGRGIDASALRGATARAGPRHGRVGTERSAGGTYVRDALEELGGTAPGARVALDAGGGAAARTARDVLEGAGCDVIEVRSARGPDPTSEGLGELAAASESCDVGVALDLDGDRAVIARRGTRCAPDATLAAGVAWAIARGSRDVAASEDTSMAVNAIAKEAGARVRTTMVGEANVVDALEGTPCAIGGEGSSAGLVHPGFNLCRDGIVAAAIAASMAVDGTLDGPLRAVSGLHRIREKVAAPAAQHGRIVEAVGEGMRGEFSENVGIGGFKGTDGESTWLLVRGSNTEDAVRVSVESDDAVRARRIAGMAREAVVGAARAS
ncbi:MAG: phosphomannomutase [Thaumarchaeota archaeon]|nr:phosphomannomutase [Nitrososphaerota archaeon]